ncbi:hypothetical protein [Streptomyces abyssomicinicus]|uniref:hypothetical protein n=1 Tax=Streptomyces abyssomicinicus TaxID=574929 RepID=UPI00124FB4D1|nr:hypothetical protein [Streptomyces abyssomicinicus]
MTGAVYVATHPVLAAHRAGLTDAYADTDRLRVNERRGWRVVQVIHLPTRAEAEHVETAVLAELRRDGVRCGVVPGDMPHGGHTETVPASAMSAVELLHLVRRRCPGRSSHKNDLGHLPRWNSQFAELRGLAA